MVLLYCSSQLGPGQSTGPEAVVMVCCSAGCHHAATLSVDTAKSLAKAGHAAAADKTQRGKTCSLQSHPLHELPTVQLLTGAEKERLVLLC